MWRARLKGAALILTLLCIIAAFVYYRLVSSTNIQEEFNLPDAGNVHSSSLLITEDESLNLTSKIQTEANKSCKLYIIYIGVHMY